MWCFSRDFITLEGDCCRPHDIGRGAERRMLLAEVRDLQPPVGVPILPREPKGAPNGPRGLGRNSENSCPPERSAGPDLRAAACIEGIQDGHFKMGDGSWSGLPCVPPTTPMPPIESCENNRRRILLFDPGQLLTPEKNCNPSEILREEVPDNDLWLTHCRRRGGALPQAAKCDSKIVTNAQDDDGGHKRRWVRRK